MTAATVVPTLLVVMYICIYKEPEYKTKRGRRKAEQKNVRTKKKFYEEDGRDKEGRAWDQQGTQL